MKKNFTIALLLCTTFASATTAFAAQTYPAYETNTISALNNSNGLDMELISRFSMNEVSEDGGLVEIVAYNSKAAISYAVAGAKGQLLIIDMETVNSKGLPAEGLVMADLVSMLDSTFQYGDMSSIAINSENTLLAVALQAEGYADNGRVALFALNEDGSLNIDSVKLFSCGVQPDALTFTPDGTKVLIANEGEPRMGYGEGVVNPHGSVSILDVVTETVTTATFDESQRQTYIDNGVILYDNATVAEDLEPEYIACNNTKAYVALQEANAVAVLDIETGTFDNIYGLAIQNFNETGLDLIADGEIKIEPQNVYGLSMPDGISLYEIDGQEYIFTANEGDGREWGEEESENFYVNEVKGTTSPTGDVTVAGKVTWFDPTKGYSSMDQEKAYIFGSRSFSIYQVGEEGLTLVSDSGSDFETYTAQFVPEHFNVSNDSLELEDRSGKKGPEPEYVAVGEVDGKTYAFTGLERTGGIMVYDVSNPMDIKFVNYMMSRDFSEPIKGDVAPEGIVFINAENSPTGKALLLAASECSGTLPVYELTTSIVTDEVAN